MATDLSWLSRSALLLGDEGINLLQNKHVLVMGLGGVGSFAAEFICRSGVGEMTIVDGDDIDPSNRNRQLPALSTNHGESKAEVMAERLLAINPALKLHVIKEFLSPDQCQELLSKSYDYVMDCIDSVSPKLLLLATASQYDTPIISAMGAGGKLDPTKIRVAYLPETHECVLALFIRKRLKKLIDSSKIKTVFSTEPTMKHSLMMTDGSNFKRSAYGTSSYIPAAFGGVCASVVIRDLLNIPVEMYERPPGIKIKKPKVKKARKSVVLEKPESIGAN